MLEEKGREMEGRVELVMVQDERRGAREDVDSANKRQLKWCFKYYGNHQLHQHLQHLQVSHHLLQVNIIDAWFNQIEENSHGSSQDETMCPGQIEWFTSKKSNSLGEYDMKKYEYDMKQKPGEYDMALNWYQPQILVLSCPTVSRAAVSKYICIHHQS